MTRSTARDLIGSAELFGFTLARRSTASRRGGKEPAPRASLDEMELLEILNAPEQASAEAPERNETEPGVETA